VKQQHNNFKNSQEKEYATMNKRTENRITYCTNDWLNVHWHYASIRRNLLPMIILIAICKYVFAVLQLWIVRLFISYKHKFTVDRTNYG